MHPNNKFIATTFLMGLVCVWAATTRCQARVLLDGQGSGLYAPEQDEVHWPVTRSDPIFWKYHGPGSEFSVIGYPLHSRNNVHRPREPQQQVGLGNRLSWEEVESMLRYLIQQENRAR